MTRPSARRFLALGHSLAFYTLAMLRLRASSRASLILRYHSVGPAEEVTGYVSPGISIAPERFDRHVRTLVSRYDVIDLDEALRRSRDGRPRGSRPGVAITFDDGYRDNFVYALPTLERNRAPATVYVVAGCVRPAPPIWTVRLRRLLGGRSAPAGPCPLDPPIELSPEPGPRNRQLTRHLRALSAEDREHALDRIRRWLEVEEIVGDDVMMDDAELRAMIDGGVTIGAHTRTHPLLTEVSSEEATREIRDSRSILERATDAPVAHFSYPNPGGGVHENPRIREIVRQAGFRTATTSRNGMVLGSSDPFGLRRIGVNAGTQERLLFRAIGGGS